jgi:hypothetical protein
MEDLMQRYDPELLAVLQTFPSVSLVNWDDLPTTRLLIGEMLVAMMASLPDSPNVAKEDRAVPGPENAPEVPVRIYRPVSNTGTLPGLITVGLMLLKPPIWVDGLATLGVFVGLWWMYRPAARRAISERSGIPSETMA